MSLGHRLSGALRILPSPQIGLPSKEIQEVGWWGGGVWGGGEGVWGSGVWGVGQGKEGCSSIWLQAAPSAAPLCRPSMSLISPTLP